MNLNQLLYFCAVAKAGSYTRAAEEANVSEPVVHRAVRSLEKACGLRLVQRRGNRIYATPEGEVVLEYAARIASLAEMAEQAVAERKEEISGRLSIGVGVAAIRYFLPAVLPRWVSEHPLVEVCITQRPPHELQKELVEDQLDLAISPGMKWDPRLTRQLVFFDNLVVVSAPDHPFSGRELVTIAELSREKVILPPRNSTIRSSIEEVEYQYDVHFKPAVEVSRNRAAKPLCKAGLGIAFLPASMVTDEVTNGQLSLLSVQGFPGNRPNFLVYRTDKLLSPEMKSFLYAVQLWLKGRAPQESVAASRSEIL